MRVIDLAIKDLTQLVRDWKAALFLMIMPIIFTLMFGFAFGGVGGATDPRLPVAVVDQDGQRLSAALGVDLLDQSDAIRPVPVTGKDAGRERLEAAVRDEEYAAAVIIPAGYEQSLAAARPLPVILVVDEARPAGITARGEIEAAAARMASAVEVARLGAQAVASRSGAAAPAGDESFLAGVGLALEAWEAPPIGVAVAQSGAIAAEKEDDGVMQSGFAHSSPAMMVQFAIAGLTAAATIVVLERKSRATRRLLTTTISRVEIILGHWLAMFAIIVAQLVILLVFGQLLGVNYAREPLAIALVTLATAFWTASLGLLIGVLARSEDQVIIFALVPMFILAAMGGAWMPLELTGRAFQAIGHLLPSAWAMDGFENIVVRGLGLESIWLGLGIMLAYGVGLFALAAWRFRFE